MRMFEIFYADGQWRIVFGEDKADVRSKYPLAFIINEIVIN